ncbi:heavy metal translocating P-type ATPase [Arthrobacter caoxuetaonis]|uniref:Cadmium-translocating P-type ATPase n=1 Tax=Arthrobacter caoxuetaonis TaxID=2886935 RepID=A0A9X1MDH5_9MICC|nr:heavy metal translocating P-type ATPase [Arthrobacter caoxuetaonis]MCC3298053.1 cadmium-translocating P-type ATPase [Arthrobacter caoxuetaonis]USQ57066.1 heavy metal translocating P-type ATPase [Arthrobacter caoxuetaonis]
MALNRVSFQKAVRTYPVVASTVVVLAAVLMLWGAGAAGPAQWIASLYTLGIVAVTGVGMVRDIKRGHYGLDILAVIAMLATVAVGEYLASLIIVLMLSGGEALEDYAAGRAKGELDALLDRAPQIAHRLPDDADTGGTPKPGRELAEDIPATEVCVGETLLIKPSEVVPVDGVLLSAAASFDESSLTGESIPVARTAGEAVMSGSVNGTQAVRIRATATTADSQYQRIVALVRDAAASRAPVVRLADRFAIPFTLVSLLIAGIAWAVSGDPVRFAEVLVLATPCPLLIAAPVAFMGGMSRSARHGIIVKGGATLEQLATARTAAFDKTGTLTYGRPELVSVNAQPGFSAEELLGLAASAEQYSSHVLAASVLAAAEERGLPVSPADTAQEVATNGVEALIHGQTVRVGKRRFIEEVDPSAGSVDLSPGQMVVYLSVDGRFAGSLILSDTARPNAAATLDRLRSLGIRDTVMLTGDGQVTANSIAAAVGISDVHAELLPEDKVNAVAALELRPVIMVGDGVNDAPVLAAADVGIAMGARGSTAASESADAVIVADDISKVATAMDISKRTLRVALGSIWLGIALSLVLMLVAAFGFIPAVAGALTQELVDLATILNALRALHGKTLFRRADKPATVASAPIPGSV